MRSWGHGGLAGLLLIGAPVLVTLVLASPAQAEVVAQSDAGFVVRVAAEVKASPAEAWKTMTTPSLWWSSQHTFSGDAANLSFDPVPGGCFCEKMPVPKGAPSGQKPGGVQHMRVIYAEPPRAIRLSGALGPLQSEALTGTLTMTIKPTEQGSRVLWEYVVGGYMRYKIDQIAPAVDTMLSGQMVALATRLGPVKQNVMPEPAPEAVPDSAPVSGPIDGDLAPKLPKSGAAWSLPPAKKPAATVPVSVSVPAKAPVKAAAKPAIKAAAKPAGKPAVKPKPKSEDLPQTDVNAAFDAALGGPATP